MRIWMVAAALSMLSAAAGAQVPNKIGYQGRLLKADGSPEAGQHSLSFKIFDLASGGSALWTEDQTVSLSDGYYAVQLGSVTALSPAVFSGGDRYLELAVDGTALSPRQAIDSVPFALLANTSTNLSGGTVNATSVTVGGANGTSIGSGGISVGGSTVVNASGRLVSSAVDTSALQSRVSGTCASGTAVTAVNQDGSVACSAVDVFISNQSSAVQDATFNIGRGASVGGNFSVATANSPARLSVTGSAPASGTGVVSGSAGSTTLNGGATTRFTSEVSLGDVIVVAGQTLVVSAQPTSDGQLSVSPALSPAITTPSSFTIHKPIAQVLQSSGAPALFANASGSLGIGTATPQSLLDVQGVASANSLVLRPRALAPVPPVDGQLYLDNSGTLSFFWSGAWVGVATALGSTAANAADSCNTIKLKCPNCASGTYWLNPGAPFKAYCEMSFAGGGWTMVSYWVPYAQSTQNTISNATAIASTAFPTDLYTIPTFVSPASQDLVPHTTVLFRSQYQGNWMIVSKTSDLWQASFRGTGGAYLSNVDFPVLDASWSHPSGKALAWWCPSTACWENIETALSDGGTMGCNASLRIPIDNGCDASPTRIYIR